MTASGLEWSAEDGDRGGVLGLLRLGETPVTRKKALQSRDGPETSLSYSRPLPKRRTHGTPSYSGPPTPRPCPVVRSHHRDRCAASTLDDA